MRPVLGTWYQRHMRIGLIAPATLETLRVSPPRAPLPGQGGARRGAFLWSRPPPLAPLLGFLPRGNAADGREAKGAARGILGLAHPPQRGHAAPRCEGIGADRHAAVSAPEGRGRLEREVQRGATLLTHSGRGQGGPQRRARGAGVVRTPLVLDHLRACQQAEGIGSPPRAAGFAGRHVLQASPPLGAGRPRLGAPGWRALEPPLGPGAQAVPMPTARLGPHLGRGPTRQPRVLQRARAPPTGRYTALAGRRMLGVTLAPARHGGRDSVAARAAASFVTPYVHGRWPLAAPVFAVRSGAAQRGEETTAPRAQRVAGPGIRHRSPHAVARLQREGPWSALRVLGIPGPEGPSLARAHAQAAGAPPAAAVGKGGRSPRDALESAGRCEADERES